MPDIRRESKPRKANNRPWRAVADSLEYHEIVGFNVKSPKPLDPKRHVWPPAIVWIWMLQKTAFADYVKDVHGLRIPLKRGQMVISQRKLSEKANWGRKAVREFLERLQRCGMIAVDGAHAQLCFVLDGPEKGPAKGPGISVVTICNYDKYQYGLQAQGPSKGPARGPRRAQERTPNNIHSNQSQKILEKKQVVIDGDRSPVSLSATARQAVVKAGQDPNKFQDRINRRIEAGKAVHNPEAYAVVSAINETAAEMAVPQEVIASVVHGGGAAVSRQAFKVVEAAQPLSEDRKRQIARTSAAPTARSALANTAIMRAVN